MPRSLAFIIIFTFSITYSIAQVGINSNGSTPDPSAMLDVKSNTKGLLIPRMTAVERQTILDPAQGLMVFDQTNNAFYYFNGIGWLELLAGTVTELKDTNGDTKIQVEETVDDDIIRFDIEGVERFKMEQNRFEIVNNNNNIFIGDDAGESTTTGVSNTVIGNQAFTSNEGGLFNLAMGAGSLDQNIGGDRNVALGSGTLLSNKDGDDNIGIGNTAGWLNENGDKNVLIGVTAGYGISPHDKSNNVMIGHRSGESNEGDGNVFIGHQSGANASGSNKLYIENSSTNSPLIFGNFANDLVRINGDLQVTGSFPASNAVSDDDDDTKIQVEESADDDIIRFDIEGVERVKIEQNRIEVVNANDNIFLGDDAGSDIVTGDNNIAIGTSSLDSLTSGYDNIALGKDVLKSNTTGESNFGAGDQTLLKNTEGRQNVAIGLQAMYENTTGRDNVGLGYFSLHDNTTGILNVALGYFTMRDNTTGKQNVGGGHFSLVGNTTGDNNSALGNFSLAGNTTGDNNAALGHRALVGNIEGSGNSALGHNSDVSSSNLRKATALGSHALVGCDNCLVLGEIDSISVGIGTSMPDEKLHIVGNLKMEDGNQQDGHVLTSDADGKATWQSVGSIVDDQTLSFDGTNLTIDDGNTVDISGVNTIQDIISDADNDTKIQLEESTDEDIIRIDINGTEKLILKTVGSNNDTQLSLTNSQNNTFIGENVGINTTSGGSNTVVGSQAFTVNNSGASNVAMGYNSLNQNTDGSQNVALGAGAFLFSKTGNDNIGIGNTAGIFNQNGDENILIGTRAGRGQIPHDKFRNVMIGHRSGDSNAGDGNIFLGYQSGENASGSNKLYIENSNTNSPLIYGEFDSDLVRINGDLEVTGSFPTGKVVADGDDDTKIQVEESTDDDAIRFDVAGAEFMKISDGTIEVFNNDNVFIGEAAGDSSATGGGNIALGSLTLDSLTTGTHNVAIGIEALKSNSSGKDNIAIGGKTLIANTEGNDNIAIGYKSLNMNTTGGDNIAIGDGAMYDNTTADDNIAIGANALNNNTSGPDNIAIGANTLFRNTSGTNNIAIGESALPFTTTGSENIGIGDGTTIIGGMGNRIILIGDGARTNVLNLNDAIAIGAGTIVSQDSSIVLGNNHKIGIGTSTPDERLHIVGNIKIEDGNEQSGYILTSDANGVGTWQEKQDLDEQMLSFDGTNLTIENGNSVNLSNINSDEQILAFDGTDLTISDGNTVDLSSIDKDEQTLTYNNASPSLSISGGNTVDLSELAVPVGAMMMWYTSTPPDGWLICDGTSFNATTYPALNTVLGGNVLPDLIGRFALGSGERNEGSNHPLTSTGGIETVLLNEQNIPAHTHDVTIGFREGHENGQGQDYSDLGASSSDHNANKTYQTDSWGGATGNPNLTLPHQNMPPFLTVNYIIKAK